MDEKVTTEHQRTLNQDLKLVHDGSMRLEIDRDFAEGAKILVSPEVADLNLAGLQTQVSKGEFGRLRDAGTVDDDESIGAIGEGTHPSFDEFLDGLGGEAQIEALEGLFLRIIGPLLVVTAVARPRLDDRALVVPDIHAQVVHAADDGLVVDIVPFLVERFLAHGLVANVARIDTELDVALVAVGDLKAETIGVADGVVTVDVPALALVTSALLGDDVSSVTTNAMSNLAALDAKLVLIDGDDLLVHEDLECLLVLLCDITADEKGCLGKSPEGEVGAVLVIGHATVADLEHIGIVPAARTSVLGPFVVLVDDRDHAAPAVADIASGTPAVSDVLGPLGGIVHTPLAHGVEDGAARLVQGIAHDGIALLGGARIGVAVVVLQVVDAPLGVGLCVDLLVAEGAGATLARVGAGVAVQTELHALGVGVVSKSLDAAREGLGISDDAVVLVTRNLPAVVKIDVVVASSNKTGVNKSVNGALDQILVDVACKLVPL